MRKSLTYAVLPLALAAGAFVVGLAGPAAAAEPACKTATTVLKDRADSGLHGDWATDHITRIVKLCEAPAAEAGGPSTYTATVTDKGTFVTVAGKSPVAGTTLPAGIKGNLTGGYTATFTAEADFKNYQHVLNGKTYTGDAAPKTADWIKALWGSDDFTSVTNMVAWKWTYWTCSTDVTKATEAWTNADPDVNTGDITGKACPSASGAVVVPVGNASTPAASAGLPVTGTNVGLIAGFAVALIAVGGGLFLVARRRRDLTT